MRKCATVASGSYCLSGIVMLLGLFLGVLVGFVSAIFTVVILIPLLPIRKSSPAVKTVLAVGGQLLGLFSVWFCGGWLSVILSVVEIKDFLVAYVGALTCTYICMLLYFFIRLVRWVGFTMERNGYVN